MSSNELRSEVVQYWWSKAEDSLASARREFEAGAYDFAVNRLYYSLFYAAISALLDRGQSFKKHAGVRSAFHLQFIKPGILGTEWGKLYDRLFEDRTDSDYAPLVSFERDYVEGQLVRCNDFLTALRPLIASLNDPGDMNTE